MSTLSFSSYHPGINFFYFAGAIICTVFFSHPLFVATSALMTILYYLLTKKKEGLRFLGGSTILAVMIALLNPVFNTQGSTVLFTYFGGRPYTKEALLYGCITAAMFISVILLFSCYNEIMTSDKFIYLFGNHIPSISIVLTMALRFVPLFKKHAGNVLNARLCMGRNNSNARDKIKNGMDTLSGLTSWALEGAVTTGDSMKNRGYGYARRTGFALYRIDGRDKAAFCTLGISCILIIFAVVSGAMRVEYIPDFEFAGFNIFTAIGLAGYLMFFGLPSFLQIQEEVKWNSLLSKI